MLPLALSAVDLAEYYRVPESQRGGKMGWFGVLLNFTNTRMLYTLLRGATAEPAAIAAIARSGGNIKPFEAVFESMPQLFIQTIVLFGGLLDDEPAIVYASLGLSVVSTAQVGRATAAVSP